MTSVRGLAAVAVLVVGSSVAFADNASNVPAVGAGPTLSTTTPAGATGAAAPTGATATTGTTAAAAPAADATAPTPPASLKCGATKVPTQVTKPNGKVVWKCVKPN
jgi:hypothetical protein